MARASPASSPSVGRDLPATQACYGVGGLRCGLAGRNLSPKHHPLAHPPTPALLQHYPPIHKPYSNNTSVPPDSDSPREPGPCTRPAAASRLLRQFPLCSSCLSPPRFPPPALAPSCRSPLPWDQAQHLTNPAPFSESPDRPSLTPAGLCCLGEDPVPTLAGNKGPRPPAGHGDSDGTRHPRHVIDKPEVSRKYVWAGWGP